MKGPIILQIAVIENLPDLQRLQYDYFCLEKSATPTAVLFPWLPGYSQIKRILTLKNLYFTLLKYVKLRRAAPVPSFDAIDLMLGQGKTDQEIISVRKLFWIYDLPLISCIDHDWGYLRRCGECRHIGYVYFSAQGAFN